MDNMIRVVIIDIKNALSSEVYDEAILPPEEACEFVQKYTDMTQYRVVTV